MQHNLEKRIAALESATAPETSSVRVVFCADGETPEQARQREGAGWPGKIICVQFVSPADAKLLSAESAAR